MTRDEKLQPYGKISDVRQKVGETHEMQLEENVDKT